MGDEVVYQVSAAEDNNGTLHQQQQSLRNISQLVVGQYPRARAALLRRCCCCDAPRPKASGLYTLEHAMRASGHAERRRGQARAKEATVMLGAMLIFSVSFHDGDDDADDDDDGVDVDVGDDNDDDDYGW